jgi:hypothetical protein
MKRWLALFTLIFLIQCSSSTTNSSNSISSEIPKFNSECKYTLQEGLSEIYKIAQEYNLSVKVNWIEDNLSNYADDCEGKIVGSNLNEGVSLLNQEKIELVVATLYETKSTTTIPEKIPDILSLNINEYQDLDFTLSNNREYSFLLNPTTRNPFSALIKLEDFENYILIDNVEAHFENEIFKYNFKASDNTIFVETYFLNKNSNFELFFKDQNDNIIDSLQINLPEIIFDQKFQITKYKDSEAWMYISGANDGNVLIIDESSEIRAFLEIPKEYTRIASRAGNQFNEKFIVFFNDTDNKYYSMDFFGNIKLWFNNDLNFQYQWHHDVSPSKYKNSYLVHVNDMKQKPFKEDVIIEINIKENSLIRVIDLKQILDINLPVIKDAFFEVDEGPENEENFDWFHGNSVEYVPSRDEIIISGRHLGLVGLDYNTLKINWFLPHNPNFYSEKQDYPILKPTFDGFIPPNGQHNLTYIEGKLVYFDNQSIPEVVNGKKDYNPYELLSYFVVLDVDFENLLINNQTLYSHEDFWSKIRGGVDYLDKNFQTILISYGGIYYDEFGARTLSRQTNPKKRSWSVVEYNEDSLVRIIEGKNGFGAYRSLFFTP